MPVFGSEFSSLMGEADVWPNGKPKGFAKGKPSKGTGKDRRLKRNRGKKKRR